MSLKDLDIGAALHRLADRKIEQAIAEGKFDRLEGAGKPLDLEPMPAEENARLRWWAVRILKQNDVTPDEVRWRKQIETYKDELDVATTEKRVADLTTLVNALVRRLNTLGTNAMQTAVVPMSLEGELAKLRGRLAAGRIATDVREGRPQRTTAAPAATAPAASSGWSAIQSCENEKCRSRNPTRATYCRRCGGRL